MGPTDAGTPLSIITGLILMVVLFLLNRRWDRGPAKPTPKKTTVVAPPNPPSIVWGYFEDGEAPGSSKGVFRVGTRENLSSHLGASPQHRNAMKSFDDGVTWVPAPEADGYMRREFLQLRDKAPDQ